MTKYLTQTSSHVLRTIMWLGLAGLCAAVLSLAGVYLYLNPQIPAPETYRDVQLETPLRIFAEDGELLAEFGERRLIPISLSDVPQQFIDALLDTEDKRFYEHAGIDFISLTNDVFSLVGTFVSEGELGGGASTITMQLARNVSFSLERRFLRKFKEMLLALKIERELSKDEILELYINLVPFGKRAYGAEAAALTYYGQSLKELTLPQLAMLAGIPQAPSAGNPINGPERALKRRNLVLSRMLAQESITELEYQVARSAPINAKVYARELDVPSPYAAEWVRQQAANILPDLYTGGYEIHTTINGKMQAAATTALRRGLIAYDNKHGYRGAEGQVEENLLASLAASAELLSSWVPPNQNEAVEAEAEEDLEQPVPNPGSGWQGDYPQDVIDQIRTTLRELDPYGGLDAAVVLYVADEHAWVLRFQGDPVALNLADSAWARAYINVDRRGPSIKSLQEVLSIGDIIRVRPGEPDDEESTSDWLLSQLPEIQGALISLDPNTGQVKALVGGFDFYRNQYNHALQAARQPGSGFKPFVYSAAVQSGVTPADIFMDAPLVFDDENLESQYRPDNDNNRYNGPTRLREALYRSINLVSMRVLLKVGAGNILDHVSQFGFSTDNFPRNTQLAIGGGTMAVTPMTMARAYAVLANGGYLIDPYIIKGIKTDAGEELVKPVHPVVCPSCEEEAKLKAAMALTNEANPIEEEEPASLEDLLASTEADIDLDTSLSEGDVGADEEAEREPTLAPRVLDERNAFVMNSMLRDVVRRGTGVSARSLGRNDLAGKTGTTNDAADTWFNGYNPDLVTTVWVGFSNHEPLGARAYGSNTPLPIWIEFMQTALAGAPENLPAQPTGVVTMKIDPTTGQAARPGQNKAVFEFFLNEFTPAAAQVDDAPVSPSDDTVKAVDLF